MSRSKIATVGIACTAGAFAATMALAGTASALPPENRAVTLTCVDINSGITYATNGAGTLSSSDPGSPNPQKMKLTSSIPAPLTIPPNSLTTTIKFTGGITFSGTINPPMNPPNPITLGPVPAASRIASGTSATLVSTSGAPSATNWSVRIQASFAGTAADIRCVGSQAAGTTFTF
ncbi:hypothetical protein [Embleya sp. NBC_00896]|uniref:hypothetical protein n=1 Tax=Embleya sp. NBC_00896 TaxID=2975961 RepID=UPI0038691321|nr:hypothetical protein OG928_20925 [Embleya sp. NBC_00896]